MRTEQGLVDGAFTMIGGKRKCVHMWASSARRRLGERDGICQELIDGPFPRDPERNLGLWGVELIVISPAQARTASTT